MKLTILDGGDVRSAFLAKSLAYNAHRIGLTEVVFPDSSADNLAIFGEIVRYIFNTIHPDTQSNTTTDPVATLQDTNYITTIPRVGGSENRIRDGRITPQHNTLGQEATGIGGFATVMCSIPATLRYCRLVEEHAAEGAILFNFTNPSDLVMEAVVKSGSEHRVYRVCDAPSELTRELPATFGCKECDLNVECCGPNHFSWSTHFTIREEEVTERLITSLELYQKTTMQYFSLELVRPYDNQLLNEYLYYHYYQEVALKAIQEADETREEQIARINQEMRETLRVVDAKTQPEAAFTIWMQYYLRREDSYIQNESQQEKLHTREPLALHQFIEEPDTGGYTGVALDVLGAVNSIATECIIVSIQNRDMLGFLRPDDVVEVDCDLSRDGLEPVAPVRVPAAQKSMISCVKEYERLAVATILQQDKSLAVWALMAYPLTGPYSLAKTLVKAYLDDEQFAAWQ